MGKGKCNLFTKLLPAKGEITSRNNIPVPPPPPYHPAAKENPYGQQAAYQSYGGMSHYAGFAPQPQDSVKVFEFRGFVGDVSFNKNLRPEQVAGTLALLDQVRNGANSYDPSKFQQGESDANEDDEKKDEIAVPHPYYEFHIPRPYQAASPPPPPPPPPEKKDDAKKCDQCKKEPEAPGLKKFIFGNTNDNGKWCWPCVWNTYGNAAGDAWQKAASI